MQTSRAKLYRRLTPLYIAAFFQGFVIWYSTEKLFMRSIGFDDATIGFMVAVYSVAMLVTETPSGLLADRWSRKGVLILASIALALSALVGGLSYGVGTFLICACLWGVFYAMYSGTYDSIVYDTLQEEGHSSELFDEAYGKIRIIDSIALVLGLLLGGVAAAAFGPRLTYFLTIPSALISIVALLYFREPMLHRAKVAVSVVEHIRSTLRAVLRRRALVPLLSVLILAAVIKEMSYEFDQLWLLALAAPAIVYGPANAILLSAIGIGGFIVRYARRHAFVRLTLFAGLLLGAFGLIFLRSVGLIIAAQMLVVTAIMSLEIYYTRDLHDALSSEVRAGAASAVSTLGRIILIPLALIFGAISTAHGVFSAAWILAATAIALVGLVRFAGRPSKA